MDNYRHVILGGGMVAGYAARALAGEHARPGDLAIISADSAPPYERPPLSKGFLTGKDDEASLGINEPGFYQEHGVDLRLNTPARAVDLRNRQLQAEDGATIGYEQLLIATGAEVRRLSIPGADLPGVHYLRTLDDARGLRRAAADAGRAIVLGAGFIGMEVAAALAQRGVATTLAFSDERVWQRLFTAPMSAFFARYYEARGVRLLPRVQAIAINGMARVAEVAFSDGGRQPADLVVAGIGVRPSTRALEGSGLALDNGVLVNEFLETGEVVVFASGDVAYFLEPRTGARRRIEHWDNAVEQGQHAARVMLGERVPFVHVPYFFSDVFDLSYEFWGDTAGADRVAYRGGPATDSFSAWWLRGERLVAAFVMNRPDEERELAIDTLARDGSLPPGFVDERQAAIS
jgi:NADPH-dependent 2,4-dienoyl-CoA reductase/sulfur reductase-like enzyme